MKNSTTEHKKVMQSNFQRQEYSLTYCSSPGKSYIIEPHGGELNYNLAEKNPLKFYDQVFNQDITQHKVKEPALKKKKTDVELSSKVTKRPYLKIMEKIRLKILQSLQAKIGQEFGENILLALQDQGIENSIKVLMKQNKIELVNENNQPIYQEQINEAAHYEENKVDNDEVESDNENEQSDYEEEQADEMVSPEMKKSNTKLVSVIS